MSTSKNIPLDPPPVQSLVSDDHSMMTTPWVRWLNNLYFKFSNKSKQTLTAAGAVDLDAQYVALDTTSGAFAITLAAPTLPCARKLIEMTVRGSTNNVTMALTNCEGGSASTTCTWSGAGQTLILESRSNKWIIIKERGVTLT